MPKTCGHINIGACADCAARKVEVELNTAQMRIIDLENVIRARMGKCELCQNPANRLYGWDTTEYWICGDSSCFNQIRAWYDKIDSSLLSGPIFGLRSVVDDQEDIIRVLNNSDPYPVKQYIRDAKLALATLIAQIPKDDTWVPTMEWLAEVRKGAAQVDYCLRCAMIEEAKP